MSKVFTITEGLENLGAIRSGGQASVYKGRRIGEIVTAVKLLPTPIHSESPEDKHYADFTNEVAKLRKVGEEHNPHVVRILSSGITETGNLPFIEMEFIEGPDLEELLQPPHDPVFTIAETIKVAEHLSDALAHCHRLDIRHGDIKSNNVKLNIRSGNYVLLDFGLAVMSDEERRTSLRHAGAIEYMAPEQNEGVLLLQTDVYSFGIVLYQLLAGEVPFPLQEKTETKRNKVMMAHLELDPPDLMLLRRERMPAAWNETKREAEMMVPEWLLTTIRKCLEKKPEDRFADGQALYDFIRQHRVQLTADHSEVSGRLAALQEEHLQLKRSHEHLQQQLKAAQEAVPAAAPIYQATTRTGGVSKGAFGVVLTLLVVLGLFAGYAWFNRSPQQMVLPTTDTAATTSMLQEDQPAPTATAPATQSGMIREPARADMAGTTPVEQPQTHTDRSGSQPDEEAATTREEPAARKAADTVRKVGNVQSAGNAQNAGNSEEQGGASGHEEHADSTSGN